jgi:L-ascorbate metabolism protein UlaG (beta-lactamase superfamily)
LAGRSLRIVYVGHATVLIELDGMRLLTDPVLGARIGPLRRQGPPPAPEVSEGIDAILISHLHRDHADLASLRRFAGKVPLIVSAGTGPSSSRSDWAPPDELEWPGARGGRSGERAQDHPRLVRRARSRRIRNR